jgi:hypothetical protein
MQWIKNLVAYLKPFRELIAIVIALVAAGWRRSTNGSPTACSTPAGTPSTATSRPGRGDRSRSSMTAR